MNHPVLEEVCLDSDTNFSERNPGPGYYGTRACLERGVLLVGNLRYAVDVNYRHIWEDWVREHADFLLNHASRSPVIANYRIQGKTYVCPLQEGQSVEGCETWEPDHLMVCLGQWRPPLLSERGAELLAAAARWWEHSFVAYCIRRAFPDRPKDRHLTRLYREAAKGWLGMNFMAALAAYAVFWSHMSSSRRPKSVKHLLHHESMTRLMRYLQVQRKTTYDQSGLQHHEMSYETPAPVMTDAPWHQWAKEQALQIRSWLPTSDRWTPLQLRDLLHRWLKMTSKTTYLPDIYFRKLMQRRSVDQVWLLYAVACLGSRSPVFSELRINLETLVFRWLRPRISRVTKLPVTLANAIKYGSKASDAVVNLLYSGIEICEAEHEVRKLQQRRMAFRHEQRNGSSYIGSASARAIFARSPGLFDAETEEQLNVYGLQHR